MEFSWKIPLTGWGYSIIIISTRTSWALAVVGNGQPTWSGIFAGSLGIFAAERRAWQQHIRRNSGLPKKVLIVQKLQYLLSKRAEITPTLEEAGITYVWASFSREQESFTLLRTCSKWMFNHVSTTFQPRFHPETVDMSPSTLSWSFQVTLRSRRCSDSAHRGGIWGVKMGCFNGMLICCLVIIQCYWLVVEPTPLKNMKVNWDDFSQYMEK